MKRILAAVLAAGAAVSAARAATPEEKAAARDGLLAGVDAIGLGGGALPGGFILFGRNAVALAACRNYDGTAAAAAAAAFYGEGRAVYLAHPGYLSGVELQRQTETFLQNAVRWLADGRARPKIAVLRNRSIEARFRDLGFGDIETVPSAEKAKRSDVLIADDVVRSDVAGILRFVKDGGGFLNGSLGWGFLYFRPSAGFSEEFIPNRVSGEMGVLMGVSGVERIDGAFPAVRGEPVRGLFAQDALKAVLGGARVGTDTHRQAVSTLSQLATALPGEVRPQLHRKLAELAVRTGGDKTPSPEAPVGESDVFARLALIAAKNAWLADPRRPVAASEGAAVYPGTVAPGTPKISVKVAIDPAVPRWHSTGVFAPAGEPLTVMLPKSAIASGLNVRIGSTADDLSAVREWKRHPRVTCQVPLVTAKTTVYSPFGGLVYIVVPERGLPGGKLTVSISGGVMAPWFKLGRDTVESFVRQCRETGAPYGEIQGKDFVITAETVGLAKVKDPRWVAEYWDRVLAACQDLAGRESRRYPERICSDVQLTAGFMHSGYPAMTHVNAERFDWAIDRTRLERGESWGCYHEIGHNHQNTDWTPEGTAEVTVNLFTLYVIETVAGADVRESRFFTGRPQADRRVRDWVAAGRTFEDWKRDPFLALEMYLRIKEAYGWDVYRKTFARYRAAGFARPGNDREKWRLFAIEMSRSAGADLGAAMAAWSVPLDASTREACSRYPAACADITDGLGVDR